MPFKSEKQRAYLYSQKPEVAKKFASEGHSSHKKGHKLKKRMTSQAPGQAAHFKAFYGG